MQHKVTKFDLLRSTTSQTSQNGQNYKSPPPPLHKNGFTNIKVREEWFDKTTSGIEIPLGITT